MFVANSLPGGCNMCKSQTPSIALANALKRITSPFPDAAINKLMFREVCPKLNKTVGKLSSRSTLSAKLAKSELSTRTWSGNLTEKRASTFVSMITADNESPPFSKKLSNTDKAGLFSTSRQIESNSFSIEPIASLATAS